MIMSDFYDILKALLNPNVLLFLGFVYLIIASSKAKRAKRVK